MPVFEETVDQIVGVLYTKDLLPHLKGLPADFDLRAHLHPPYFVPESKRADALLREFQAKKLHLAIVVDEYGGTAGLVTLEDLLEELVGEIRDEFDEEERLIQKVDAASYRVSGKLPIDELNAATGLNLPNESFDTVGGWVLDLFGRVPHQGEKTQTDEVTVTVEKVERTRVVEVLVEHPARGGQEPGGMIYVWGIAAGGPGHGPALRLRDGVHRRQPRAHPPPGRERQRHGGRYLEAFRHPERMLSAAMMGVTVAHIAASSLATWALLPVAGGWAGRPRHGDPASRSCSSSARSSPRRWPASGRRP